MSSRLIKIIGDYIIDDNTDYGILITGSWGSGKSFFLKNSLEKELLKNGISGKDYIHISLFGIKTVDELVSKIVRAKIPFLNKKPVNGAFAVLQMIGSRFKAVENFTFKEISKSEQKQIFELLNIGTKNDVYIFDDLERIDDQDILLSILGYVNEISENNNSKVLLVADESRLFGFAKYSEYKEKIIRFTTAFDVEGYDIAKLFIENIKSKDLKSFFLASEEKMLKKLWEWHQMSGSRNLRTLQFILSIFHNLLNHFRSIQATNTSFDNFLLERMLFFTSTYSYELKSGKSAESLDALKSIRERLNYSNFEIEIWRKKISDQVKKDKGRFPGSAKTKDDMEVTPKDELIYLFEEKYQVGQDKNQFEFYPIIKEYIINGFLDDTEFVNKIKQDIKILENEKSPEDLAVDKISSFVLLEDAEVKNEFENLLEFVKSHKYPFDRLPIIFQLAKDLLHHIPIKNVAEVKEIFKEAIDNTSFEGEIHRFGLWENDKGDDDKVEIWKYFYNVYEKLVSTRNTIKMKGIITDYTSNNLPNFRKKLEDSENHEIPVFTLENIDVKFFFEKYTLLSNKDKREVFHSFRESYRYANGLKDTKEKERSFFETLRNLILKYTENVREDINKKVEYLNISEFGNWIDKVLTH